MTASAPIMPPESRLARIVLQRLAKPRFKGDLIENAKRFRFVGPAYKSMPKEQDGYFKIKSARQCAGPLAALHDPDVREVGIIGSTQGLKSMPGNVWLMGIMEHDPADALVLFENDKKAQEFSERRIMPTLRAHPVLKERLKVETETRHDVTKTKITTASMSLKIGALNDSDISTFSYRYVWISEAWQHHDDGMMEKAMARTDRYPDNHKILIESQAGLAGGDLHRWTTTAHAVHYVWACPFCGGKQTWECANEFGNLREPNFIAIKPRNAPDNWQPPKAGTYSGMKFPKDGTIDQRARAATWECHWCGMQIKDTDENRRAIADSSEQNYKIQVSGILTSPKAVVFYLPFECNTGNSFEKSAKKYLAAKEAASGGNKLPMTDWYISHRAYFFDPNLATEMKTTISAGTYDPLKYLEMFGKDDVGASLFHSVNMAVDCQEDADHKAKTDKSITGWFWYIVRAYDKFGNNKQLARGYCKSWSAWRAVQAFWGVPNDRVMIDVVQWSEQVMNKAVEFRQMVKRSRPHPIFKTMEDTVTWKLLAASPGKQNFKGHRDGQIRPWSAEASVYGSMIDESGKVRRIPLARILFNKTPVQLQVDSLYSGAPGLPKFEFLSRTQLKCPSEDGKELVPDTLTLSMEVDGRTGKPTMLAYENQMSAQIYNKETNKYDELRADDHYYWCEQALLVRVGMDGLLGQSAVFAAEAETKTV